MYKIDIVGADLYATCFRVKKSLIVHSMANYQVNEKQPIVYVIVNWLVYDGSLRMLMHSLYRLLAKTNHHHDGTHVPTSRLYCLHCCETFKSITIEFLRSFVDAHV